MGFNKKRWQASNFDEKIGVADGFRRMGDTPFFKGIKVGQNTRNTGGDQVITEVGFKPRIIIFVTSDETIANMNWGIGFDDGIVHRCVYIYWNNTKSELSSNYSLIVSRDAGNYLFGSVSALSENGFTITWALTGDVGLDYMYLAFL